MDEHGCRHRCATGYLLLSAHVGFQTTLAARSENNKRNKRSYNKQDEGDGLPTSTQLRIYNIIRCKAMEEFKLSSVEDAVKDFKEGKFVIVVDDEDRENEGDLIAAAEMITPEKVNFMLKNARGVLCVPITLSRCEELDLPHQVSDNTSMLGTPFTITVDKLEGCSTGVSSHDRDRKSTRLNSQSRQYLVCRLLLEKKNY